MSNPVDRFCEVVAGMAEEDANAAISMSFLALGGTHADIVLPELPRLREKLEQLIQDRMMEEFLIPSLFHYLITYFGRWVNADQMAELVDLDLGLLEDLRADLLRPPETRRSKLSEHALRDLIGKSQGVVPRRNAQREQGLRIISHLVGEQSERFSPAYWSNWNLNGRQ